MQPPEEKPRPAQSLAARLRQRFGTEVDPQVELPSDPEPESLLTEGAAGPTSSGDMLDRLETRGQTASRYQLRGEIARGGMGAILEVFDEDLRRRLAMKVILDREGGAAGADSRSVNPALLARFLEEAQVTGQLDHPGIVPVHELGIDENGQVYFTMRLVHGRNLELIFDLALRGSEGWTLTRAVGVLQKVCEAMAYAHSKGVVHRDLKPANVMVGRFGEVYVMDWGLARVRNLIDRHDLRIRPAAGAPEAARSADATASALGTSDPGSACVQQSSLESLHPVETDRRGSAADANAEALHTMDGSVIGTPSYMSPEQARGRIDGLDERTDVYAVGAMLYRLLSGLAPYTLRGEPARAAVLLTRVLEGPPTALEQHARDAPAELLAICAKAMARMPQDRYPDMLALSEDLRAFLEGRVVAAFEVGAIAEARKWVRRNRPLAAALAATLLALAVGLAASLVLANKAARNATLAEVRRAQADTSADAARRQAKIAEESNAFLNEDLLASISPERSGIDVSVREVLDQAAQRLDGRFADEPAVEAALRMTIGTSYLNLGEYEPARLQLERALELRKSDAGPRGAQTLESLDKVANVWGELGRVDEAIALYRSTIEIAREVLGPEHRGTLSMSNDLAILLSHTGHGVEARELYNTLLPVEERVFGADDPDTLATWGNLALLDAAEGRLEQALQRQREILLRRVRASGERHPDSLIARSNVATSLTELGRFDEAETLVRSTLEIRRSVLGPSHPLVAREMATLGTLLFRQGRAAEAEQVLSEALRICRDRYGEDHPQTLQARHNLDVLIQENGRVAESLELEQAVLEARVRVLGPKHIDTLDSMNSVAGAWRALGRLDEAETLYGETLTLQREVLGPDHPSTLISYENLANVLFNKHQYSDCEAILREVLEARTRVLGELHPDVAKTTYNLGLVLKAEGHTAQALELLRGALERHRVAFGTRHSTVATCLQSLGDLEFETGARKDALVSYGEALEILRDQPGEQDKCGYLLHQIGAAQRGLEDLESARHSFAEALALRERLLGPEHPGTRASLLMTAKTLEELGRFAEAEVLALDYVARTTRAGDAGTDQLQFGRKLLEKLYLDWGKPEAAARWQ